MSFKAACDVSVEKASTMVEIEMQNCEKEISRIQYLVNSYNVSGLSKNKEMITAQSLVNSTTKNRRKKEWKAKYLEAYLDFVKPMLRQRDEISQALKKINSLFEKIPYLFTDDVVLMTAKKENPDGIFQFIVLYNRW